MAISITLWNLILLFGSLQGVWLAIILFVHKKGNKRANNILAILIIAVSFKIISYLITELGIYKYVPHVIGLAIPMLFLIGPLYYLYGQTILNRKYKIQFSHIIHFFPLLFYILYYFDFYSSDGKNKILFIEASKELSHYTFSVADYILFTFLLLHMATYIILSKKFFSDYITRLKEKTSDISILKFEWFHTITKGIIIYLFLYVFMLFFLSFNSWYTKFVDEIIALIQTLLIHVLGYLTVTRSDLFKLDAEERIKGKKYSTSALSDELRSKYLKLIIRQMEEEELYLKNDLRISELAKITSIPQHYVSQIINQDLGKNFFDFINDYRIDHAKKLLLNPNYSKISISGIAYEVGFNSKVTFYRIFKKINGVTPSEFVKLNANY